MKKFYLLKNWDNYTTDVNHQIFSHDLIQTNLNNFWKEIVETKINENQHILFLFRLQWSNNQFATIGNLQKLNKEDKDYILNYILDEMVDKGEYYKEQSIISITFSYGVREEKAMDKIISTNVEYQNYYHHKLPITMNPLKYGKLLWKQDNVYTVQINDTNLAIIIIHDKYNEVIIYRKAILIYKYKDIFVNNESFIRDFGSKKFHFTNNEMKLLTVEKPVKFIQALKKGRKSSK